MYLLTPPQDPIDDGNAVQTGPPWEARFVVNTPEKTLETTGAIVGTGGNAIEAIKDLEKQAEIAGMKEGRGFFRGEE